MLGQLAFNYGEFIRGLQELGDICERYREARDAVRIFKLFLSKSYAFLILLNM